MSWFSLEEVDLASEESKASLLKVKEEWESLQRGEKLSSTVESMESIEFLKVSLKEDCLAGCKKEVVLLWLKDMRIGCWIMGGKEGRWVVRMKGIN